MRGYFGCSQNTKHRSCARHGLGYMFMKKVLYVVSLAMTLGLWACGNKTASEGECCQDSLCTDSCCSNSHEDSLECDGVRGDGDVFESADAEIAGPGENKPCHVSGCKCKFGYAGNWDAKYCNKCSHEMSKHY